MQKKASFMPLKQLICAMMWGLHCLLLQPDLWGKTELARAMALLKETAMPKGRVKPLTLQARKLSSRNMDSQRVLGCRILYREWENKVSVKASWEH